MTFELRDPSQQILHWQKEGEHQFAVTCDLTYRYLWLDQQCQSQLLLRDPAQICFPHLQQLCDLLPSPLPTLLQFGLGGGELNRALSQRSPQTRLVTVESKATVIQLYQQYFQQAGSTEQLICQEAGAFLLQSPPITQQYALIFVDLYPTPAALADWLPLLFNLLCEQGHLWLNLTDPALLIPIQQQSEALQRQWPHQLRVESVHGYLNQLCRFRRLTSSSE